MGIFKSIGSAVRNLRKSAVYHMTEKPEHYVHVDKASSLQEKRQAQYNKWCRRYGVYNGSYLPERPETLLKKGWKDITTSKARIEKPDQTHYQRKSDLQIVRHDDETNKQFAHWHWENRTTLEHKFKKGDNFYKDRYGLETKRGRLESHLNCLDRDYIDKKGK